MDINFIIVNKIVQNRNGDVETQPERIRVNEIKSYRNWHKNKSERMMFKGQDVSLLYMYKKKTEDDKSQNTDDKTNVTTIKVLESLVSLDERLGVIGTKED